MPPLPTAGPDAAEAPFPDREHLLAAYTEGVAAVVRHAGAVADWSAPTPCAGWDARDLAGHVLCIANYYNRLLNLALAGTPARDLPRGAALNQMNADDLAALPADQSGPERLDAFAAAARRHAARLAEADWGLVLGEWMDLGPLTVGQHTGLGVGEWHLHAWDFARVAGDEHTPTDPVTVATGRARLPGFVLSVAPWTAVLRHAGRRNGDEG